MQSGDTYENKCLAANPHRLKSGTGRCGFCDGCKAQVGNGVFWCVLDRDRITQPTTGKLPLRTNLPQSCGVCPACMDRLGDNRLKEVCVERVCNGTEAAKRMQASKRRRKDKEIVTCKSTPCVLTEDDTVVWRECTECRRNVHTICDGMPECGIHDTQDYKCSSCQVI